MENFGTCFDPFDRKPVGLTAGPQNDKPFNYQVAENKLHMSVRFVIFEFLQTAAGSSHPSHR
jgi:hypothetical protein